MGHTCPTCLNEIPADPELKKLEKQLADLRKEQAVLEEALHTNLARQHHVGKAIKKLKPS